MKSKFANFKAVVFNTHHAKNADKVVHLLLENGSHKVVIAKGVKKPTSRKAHAIDLLNSVSCKVVAGRGPLDVLTEVKLLSQNSKFKQDYKGLLFVQAVSEVINIFAQEDQQEPGYYNNLVNMLSVPEINRLPLLLSAFILRYLYLSGDLPKLNEDIHTTEPISEQEKRYQTHIIGYTKDAKLSIGEVIPERIYKTQRFILKQNFSTIQRVDLEPEEQLKMLKIHLDWLRILTNKELVAIKMFLGCNTD